MPSGQGWGRAPVAELDTGLAFPIPTHLCPPWLCPHLAQSSAGCQGHTQREVRAAGRPLHWGVTGQVRAGGQEKGPQPTSGQMVGAAAGC